MEENDRVIGQTIDVVSREDTNLSSLSSISASLFPNVNLSTESSKKKEKVQVINYNHDRNKSLFRDENFFSAGCDWPIGLTSTYIRNQ